ncbi:nociceptin receptor-like [Acanthaster planci]|uniref:Nociceptin receptor-like n=1 Tax=Acanthaster planci TaxID=133434 RepID=A0A8B7ZVB1_ACAPL|nr:nociceptin receptor-like [Acanthaster planci]
MFSTMAPSTTSDSDPTGDAGDASFTLWQTRDVLRVIIACLAVLSNSMVIIVIRLRHHMFRSFTNHLIWHQAAIDAGSGVVLLLYTIGKKIPAISVLNQSSESSRRDQLVCHFVYSEVFLWYFEVASTYNLVIISLERLVAICHPVRHRNSWTRDKHKFAIVAAWSIAFVYGLPIAFFFEPHQGSCRAVDLQLGVQILVGVMSVTIEYLFPLSIMIYAYTRILITLTKKINNSADRQHNTLTKAKKNVLVTVLLASIMFVICWTPVEVDHIDELFFANSFGQTTYDILTALLACNMIANPIIYCFKYEHFRSQLRYLLKKPIRRNPESPEQHMSLSITAREL